MPSQTPLSRQILNLAIPALGTLIAQPLFTAIDSAMVGHLGTSPLAGLSLGSTILTTTTGIFIFLAYSTTAITAKHFGNENPRAGLKAGIDALWLAIGLGTIVSLTLIALTPALLEVIGPSTQTSPYAEAYLTYATFGLPGIFASFAATGTLRGLLDTRTPFIVATCGALGNTILNAILIYGINLGVAGSALGTSITELTMGGFLSYRVFTAARAEEISFKPDFKGIWKATATGAPLLIRTIAMRISLLMMTLTLTRTGDYSLAGHQIVITVWSFGVFTLDALAIAAQALVGRATGKAEWQQTRAVLRTLTRWGVICGALLGLAVAALSPAIPGFFTSDVPLQQVATFGLLISAPFYLIAGYVFILDGVLIGAGDNHYLAVAATLVTAVFVPALLVCEVLLGAGSGLNLQAQTDSLGKIWILFGIIFTGGRALTLWCRTRGNKWLSIKAD